jgi:hypothetical protein
MFSWWKKQPGAMRLDVELRSSTYATQEFTFEVPDDGSWKYTDIGGKLIIRNSDGTLDTIFDPQAGFSVIIKPIYPDLD